MKKLMSIVVLAMLPGMMLAGNKKMDLDEALKSKSINMTAVNFAGLYQGKSTKLTLTNNTKNVLEIKVALATILNSDEAGFQPMVLAGEETLVMLPHTTGEVDVQTFCGAASAHCPTRDLHYTFSHVGSDTLVKVCKFIKDNGLYDDLGQSGVWAVTSHHELSGVYDPQRVGLSEKFSEVIRAATGYQKPEYHVGREVSQVPNEPAYVPKILKIYAQFEIILQAPKTMTLGIYDKDGNMAQPVFENKQFGISGHRFDVEFEAENVAAGDYFIRLKEGDAVLQEKKVVVE